MLLKQLLPMTLLFILCSCATKVPKPTIEESSLDSLRSESLNRMNLQALENTRSENKKLALCHKKEYNKASTLFKDSLDKNQKNAHYWNQLGICYFLKEEYSKSQMYLGISQGLAKKKSMKAIVLNNLGLIQLKLQNFPEARDFFEKSIETDKRALTPKFNLAMLYSKFGLLGKAQKLLFELRSKNKIDPDINYQIAHIFLLKKQFTKAKLFFEKIPTKYLQRDDVLTNYATTLYFLGDYKKAQSILGTAPKVMPHYAETQADLISKIENNIQSK